MKLITTRLKKQKLLHPYSPALPSASITSLELQALNSHSRLSFTELGTALENARKIYDDFEEFRGDSRREFWRQLWKQFR